MSLPHALTRIEHELEIRPVGDGLFDVVCLNGCPLGTAAHHVNKQDADKRVNLHRLATAPLTPYKA